MKVVKMDENLRNRLRESGLSQKMKSLEFCKFLIIEEENNVIVAATGIGGMFNVHSIQIADTHQGKGLGKKLFGALVDEAKKQGYSFLFDSINPENTPIVKLVKSYGFEPLFRIHYSKEVVRDSGILILKPKGKTVKNFFRFFNTKGGMFLLAIGLKIFKALLFRRLLSYPSEEFPNPEIQYIISNFEKI